MADGLKMLIAMALFFGAMYLYAISPELIEKLKDKRSKYLILRKEKNRAKEKVQLQKNRDQSTKVILARRDQIKQHFKWLEEMNDKIKQNAETSQKKLVK